MQVDFYHLTRAPLDRVLPKIAEKVIEGGGRLLIVDMMPHDRDDLLQEMGHVWRGFSEDQVSSMFETAGFSGGRYHPLPPDEAAKGPTLFAAVARRREVPAESGADVNEEGAALALSA